jgi:hypothetical protein
MLTTVATTITTPQVIVSLENLQATIEIKIAGQNFRCSNFVRVVAMKFHHANAADAGAVP